MSESMLATNNIGSGAIEKYDPVMGLVSRIKTGKKLRDILGDEKKKTKKDTGRD